MLAQLYIEQAVGRRTMRCVRCELRILVLAGIKRRVRTLCKLLGARAALH